ncbi:MAG: exsH, partial [Caulobacteraceae bacterium]|nr:exsH [Caulobacteraceae bacterium]
MTYFNARGVAMSESAAEQARIVGTAVGAETINAPAGNSSLSGEGGGDLLVGNSLDNRHWITDPKDRVLEQANGGIDTEIGWTSIRLAPNVENLIVNGHLNYAVGNDLGNLIVVDDTSHWLYGAGGDDVLVGGPSQKATFVVRAGEGSDVIYNWNGNSQVQLLDYGFTTAAQIKGAMTQVGADVVLRLNPSESLTFREETLGSFADRQFLLPLDTSKLGALTFSDEFNSLQVYNPSLQTGIWRADFGGNLKDQWAYTLVSNGETQVYAQPGFQGRGEADLDVNPFSVANGVLTITAAPVAADKAYAAWNRDYTSGMLNTLGMFEQKYGYFEVRAEMPTAVGSWPAFWMMTHPFVSGVEADIFEGLALTPDVDYRRAFGGTDTQFDNALKLDPSGFHTYGMLWTPQTVTFYYDGVAVLQGATPAAWTQPMAMILNLAVGGWGGTPTASMFPTTMQIDYVHAYALADGSTQVVHETPEAPVATIREHGGPTSGETNSPVVFA